MVCALSDAAEALLSVALAESAEFDEALPEELLEPLLVPDPLEPFPLGALGAEPLADPEAVPSAEPADPPGAFCWDPLPPWPFWPGDCICPCCMPPACV